MRSERAAIVLFVRLTAQAVHVAAVPRAHGVRAAHAAILAEAPARDPVAMHAGAAEAAKSLRPTTEPLALRHPVPLMQTHEAGEHGEAVLLRIVEALVERRRRIGELLQC